MSGPADKSYGVHVAKLAKLPDELIKRAEEILSKYEKMVIILKILKQVLKYHLI